MGLARHKGLILLFAGSAASVSGSDVPDITPDDFELGSEMNALRGTEYTGLLITVSGLGTGVAANVSLMSTNGTGYYSKNGGAYSQAITTAVNNDTFQVKLTSSAAYGTTVAAGLGIGTFTDAYTISTLNDPALSGGATIDFSDDDATLNPLFI